MKTVDVEVDDMIADVAVRGMVTVEYYDANNWRVCSIGIDIFKGEEQYGHAHINPLKIWKDLIPALTNEIEDRIVSKILEQ